MISSAYSNLFLHVILYVKVCHRISLHSEDGYVSQFLESEENKNMATYSTIKLHEINCLRLGIVHEN